ncbi:MAG: AIM24 family protein [Acidimicrobiales bacterium]
MPNPPAGWYDDPAGDPSLDRFWNGDQWTEHTRSSESAPPPPPPADEWAGSDQIAGATVGDHGSQEAGYEPGHDVGYGDGASRLETAEPSWLGSSGAGEMAARAYENGAGYTAVAEGTLGTAVPIDEAAGTGLETDAGPADGPGLADQPSADDLLAGAGSEMGAVTEVMGAGQDGSTSGHRIPGHFEHRYAVDGLDEAVEPVAFEDTPMDEESWATGADGTAAAADHLAAPEVPGAEVPGAEVPGAEVGASEIAAPDGPVDPWPAVRDEAESLGADGADAGSEAGSDDGQRSPGREDGPFIAAPAVADVATVAEDDITVVSDALVGERFTVSDPTPDHPDEGLGEPDQPGADPAPEPSWTAAAAETTVLPSGLDEPPAPGGRWGDWPAGAGGDKPPPPPGDQAPSEHQPPPPPPSFESPIVGGAPDPAPEPVGAGTAWSPGPPPIAEDGTGVTPEEFAAELVTEHGTDATEIARVVDGLEAEVSEGPGLTRDPASAGGVDQGFDGVGGMIVEPGSPLAAPADDDRTGPSWAHGGFGAGAADRPAVADRDAADGPGVDHTVADGPAVDHTAADGPGVDGLAVDGGAAGHVPVGGDTEEVAVVDTPAARSAAGAPARAADADAAESADPWGLRTAAARHNPPDPAGPEGPDGADGTAAADSGAADLPSAADVVDAAPAPDPSPSALDRPHPDLPHPDLPPPPPPGWEDHAFGEPVAAATEAVDPPTPPTPGVEIGGVAAVAAGAGALAAGPHGDVGPDHPADAPEPGDTDGPVGSPVLPPPAAGDGATPPPPPAGAQTATPAPAVAATADGQTTPSGVSGTVGGAGGIRTDLLDGRFHERPIERVGLQNPRMLKVMLGDDVLARQGSMVAFQGDIDFAYEGAGAARFLKKVGTGEGVPLMRCRGRGELFLADAGALVHVVHLDGSALSVNGRNVLAFETSLEWDIHRVSGAGLAAGGLFNTRFSGHGWVAITTEGEPLILTTDQPTFVDTDAVVAWSADLTTSLRSTIKAGSLVGRGSGEAVQLALEGDGIVIVQPSEGIAVPTV